MEDFHATLAESKKKLRTELNGKYVDRKDYLSEIPSPIGDFLVDINKLTPEMRAAYERRCAGCMNSKCRWCKYNGCWDELFNPLPDGFMFFALKQTPFSRELVRNECTDEQIKYIVEAYKNNNIQQSEESYE